MNSAPAPIWLDEVDSTNRWVRDRFFLFFICVVIWNAISPWPKAWWSVYFMLEALIIPGVIFNESMLSYLGIVKLGSAGATSLGTLLADASAIWTNYPHLMIVPAAFISLLEISFNLFGIGLRDAFNPSLRNVEG